MTESKKADGKYAELFNRTIQEVGKWCEDRKIPRDHGLAHFYAVLKNFDLVDESTRSKMSEEECITNRLACFLHDVDDRKLRKIAGLPAGVTGGEKYPWAWYFLRDWPKEIAAGVVERIALVSASENGDSKVDNPLLLIARDCDRLEAIGVIGIERCFEYSRRHGIPLCTRDTPLCLSYHTLAEEEVKHDIADYKKSGGVSASMMDHYLDKLLHFHTAGSGDSGLQDEFDKRIVQMRFYYIALSRVVSMIEIPEGGLPIRKGDERLFRVTLPQHDGYDCAP